jgi:hypothetical protein
MILKTEIVTEFDNSDWDNLLKKEPTSTAFQMSKNYDPYREAFGSKPLFITTKDSTGNILAQLLAVQHFPNMTSSDSFKSIINNYSTLYWHYGPIIHTKEHNKEIILSILHALKNFSKKNNVLIINGSFIPNSKNIHDKQFSEMSYGNTKWDTWITDLKPDIDILYKLLHNKTRYDIRKGEKNNFNFEIVNDRNVLNEWMEIKYSDNKQKDEIIKKNEKFNDFCWDILYKSGFEKMYVARLNGEIVSGITNKLFNQNVIQHSVINTKSKLQGGSFLTWNAIKWSKENNFLTYDVGGANPNPISEKEKGIRHYKSKWNGNKLQFNIYTNITNKTKWKISKVINNPTLIFKKFF